MNTTANTTRIRWWIAGLMWLAIAINYIDRTVLSAAAPHLIDELKLDPEMMGFIMAAFFWSYSFLVVIGIINYLFLMGKIEPINDKGGKSPVLNAAEQH